MNEISQAVAFWILDAWRRLGSQLQTGYLNSAGCAEGDSVQITRVETTGAKFSMETIGRTMGQNKEWTISLAGSGFSFDPDSEGGCALTVEFSNGNTMLLTESSIMTPRE